MNRLVVVAACMALLSGCGSSVKLDDVPVEDRSGSVVSPAQGTLNDGSSSGIGQSTVTGTQLGQSDQEAAMRAASRLVYFDYDSFVIRSEFQPVIQSHARFLNMDRNRKVVVEGHTDERGGREYNLALGQKRAEAVRRALNLLGVADTQVEAVSFGEEKPVATDGSEQSMASNRRAEIVYR